MQLWVVVVQLCRLLWVVMESEFAQNSFPGILLKAQENFRFKTMNPFGTTTKSLTDKGKRIFIEQTLAQKHTVLPCLEYHGYFQCIQGNTVSGYTQ